MVSTTTHLAAVAASAAPLVAASGAPLEAMAVASAEETRASHRREVENVYFGIVNRICFDT